MPESSTLTVAMIGLGAMGGPMTDHVIDAGFRVRAFDLAPDALAARVERGATACASPADAATGADVVGIVVFDDAQVREVLEGDDGVLAALAPDAVIALHSTVLVATVREFAAAAGARGARLVDAGITGGEVGSKAGTLVTMVGGDTDAVDRVRPVLATFSKDVLHVGPLGTGMALKLSRNLIGYVTMAAVYEGMVLAHHAGVDVQLLAGLLREPAFEAQVFGRLRSAAPDRSRTTPTPRSGRSSPRRCASPRRISTTRSRWRRPMGTTSRSPPRPGAHFRRYCGSADAP
jgi:3-hydroxyisobutyrate dehydrogenase